MSPSATPATQSGAAPRATNGDQARHQVQQAPRPPRPPRQTQVNASKRHACHVKRRWMSPSATPATQSGAAPRATNDPSATSATPTPPNTGKCLQAPRLLRETKVDVTKCHACQAKWRRAPGDQQRPSAPPCATSATPATPNSGKLANVSKSHACHVERRWMSPSATPATQNEGV